jgi:DNA-binding transcriptional regulator YdaS (Cro superfamily)
MKKSDLEACRRGLEQAVVAVKTVTALADKLGISKQAVSDWHGVVPRKRVVEVEQITNVPRDVLRPDIFKKQGA